MRRPFRFVPTKSVRLLSLSMATILLGNVRQALQPLPTEWLGWLVWGLWVAVVGLVGLTLAALVAELTRRPPEPPFPLL